jgi:2-aminoadipate transaminase
VVAELSAAKQNTDQCAGGLGQRLVEEYGRAGGFERHLPAARALYASHWAALSAALTRYMPEVVDWTMPTGGFMTWLTLPEELDMLDMRPAAIAAGVAYVPGPPFHVGDNGHNTLRLSFSQLTETELETAVDRLAAVVRGALEQAHTGPRAGRL